MRVPAYATTYVWIALVFIIVGCGIQALEQWLNHTTTSMIQPVITDIYVLDLGLATWRVLSELMIVCTPAMLLVCILIMILSLLTSLVGLFVQKTD